MERALTIRPAYADDELALARLAALDSATVPRGRLLVAEVDGELKAAVSTADGRAIADPFVRTAEIVALLRQAARPPAEPRRRRAGWGAARAHARPLRSPA